ncbi:hypothetical protein XENOCAPTIV_004435 [Xenoophorus captivus]|uniref:Uncharacterized protein n=1 Tax=Xenoophorus captivus TaxID=1517983 RepID=A0ABV0RTF9_9TELE
METHLFMTPGTTSDQPARGALHCGVQEPRFTYNRWKEGGFESSLDTQPIFHVWPFCWLSYKHISLNLLKRFDIQPTSFETVWTHLLEVLRCNFIKKEKGKKIFISSPYC